MAGRRQEPPHLRRRRPSLRQHANPIYLWGGADLFLSLWYLTPVSDWIVSVVLSTVSLSSDVELGKAAWRDMRKTHKLVRDEWGVKQVGQQLVQQAAVDDMEMEWSFGVVHANVVNAYCFPGGIVRVSDSLLRKLDLTQGELAALLGHEIGHVLHRHAQRRIIQQDLLSLVTQALLYDDEDVVDETFGQAVGELMLKSAKYLGRLSFSRKDEYQADVTSWELLVSSGLYQPHSL